MSEKKYDPNLKMDVGNTYPIQLRFDEPKTGEGEYGTWYRYAVNYMNSAFVWFAPKKVHEVIQDLRLKKGDTFQVKVGAAKNSEGKLYQTYVLITSDGTEIDLEKGSTLNAMPSPNLEAPTKKLQETAKAVLDNSRPSEDLAGMLVRCFDAVKELKPNLSDDVVERMAVSVFIEHNRRGTIPNDNKNSVTPPAASNTQEPEDNIPPPSDDDMPF